MVVNSHSNWDISTPSRLLQLRSISIQGTSMCNLVQNEMLVYIHFASCSIQNGLQESVAGERLKVLGPNVISITPDRPVWLKFLFSFFSGFMPVLWVAAVLAFISWSPLSKISASASTYELILSITLFVIILVSSLLVFCQVHSNIKLRWLNDSFQISYLHSWK